MKHRFNLAIAFLVWTSLASDHARAQVAPVQVAPPQVVPAQDAYYVVVFGAQPPGLKNPRRTHSFATFIRTDAAGGVEYFTISWLPVNGNVRPWAIHPEVGRNWGLEETLRLCRELDLRVATFGPYQIDCDLWNRAVVQKQWLESGNVLYKAMDNGSKDGTISNCIHAVSYMAREPGQAAPYVFVAPANWGESGSYWIALTLRPWYLDPCNVRHDIMCRIGLDPRDFKNWTLDRNPTRDPATRTIQAVLHRHLLPNRVVCDLP